jgi:hypothetical protein
MQVPRGAEVASVGRASQQQVVGHMALIKKHIQETEADFKAGKVDAEERRASLKKYKKEFKEVQEEAKHVKQGGGNLGATEGVHNASSHGKFNRFKHGKFNVDHSQTHLGERSHNASFEGSHNPHFEGAHSASVRFSTLNSPPRNDASPRASSRKHHHSVIGTSAGLQACKFGVHSAGYGPPNVELLQIGMHIGDTLQSPSLGMDLRMVIETLSGKNFDREGVLSG